MILPAQYSLKIFGIVGLLFLSACAIPTVEEKLTADPFTANSKDALVVMGVVAEDRSPSDGVGISIIWASYNPKEQKSTGTKERFSGKIQKGETNFFYMRLPPGDYAMRNLAIEPSSGGAKQRLGGQVLYGAAPGGGNLYVPQVTANQPVWMIDYDRGEIISSWDTSGVLVPRVSVEAGKINYIGTYEYITAGEMPDNNFFIHYGFGSAFHQPKGRDKAPYISDIKRSDPDLLKFISELENVDAPLVIQKVRVRD